MNTMLTLALVAAIIGLLCAAYVTHSVMRNVDKIGNIPELKKQTISRALFNFYAILALILVIFARSMGLLGNDLFIGLFVLILGGLGFKVTAELFDKK